MKQTKSILDSIKLINSYMLVASMIVLLPTISAFGQQSSVGTEQDWATSAAWASGTWTAGGAPLTGINDEITINGEIFTSSSSLEFAIDAGKALTIESGGELTVFGDMTLTSTANMNIEVKSGGVLKVLGDFITDPSTFLTIIGNGIVVISGDLDLSATSFYSDPGPTNNYIYVGGSEVNGVISVEKDFTDLESDHIALYNEVQAELPIVLLSFVAVAHEQGVELDWATASEENFDYFELQRSDNGIGFDAIGKISGHGNSSQTIQYSYKDYSADLGTLYYRLKAVDFDGTFEMFETVRVDNTLGTNLKVFPNPLNQSIANLQINFEKGVLANQIAFFDASGRVVLQEQLEEQLPKWQLTEVLPKGTYYIHIQTSNQIVKERLVVN